MAEGVHLVPGARAEDVDLTGVHLHSVSLEGATLTDAWLRGTEVSGDIEGLVVNGVEVGPLVEAELDRRQPDRAMLRASDPDGLRAAWAMLEGRWAATIERARGLPEAALDERVGHEWSLTETLRHLVFATDSWVLRMVLQRPLPYHPLGLAGSWLDDPRALGLDPDATPTFAEVLAAREGRVELVRDTLATLSAEDLGRRCPPPDALGHPQAAHLVLECLRVTLREEWEHGEYANRDLAVLGSRA